MPFIASFARSSDLFDSKEHVTNLGILSGEYNSKLIRNGRNQRWVSYLDILKGMPVV